MQVSSVSYNVLSLSAARMESKMLGIGVSPCDRFLTPPLPDKTSYMDVSTSIDKARIHYKNFNVVNVRRF